MERPTWEHGDTLKSLKGIIGLGKVALAELIGKIDSKLANAINGDDEDCL